MAFQIGTMTGLDDAIDKLRLFLQNDGWTINLYEDDNSMPVSWTGLIGTGKRLHVQKTASDGVTDMHFNFRSTYRGVIFNQFLYDTKIGSTYYQEITGIAMYGSTGYDPGEPWDTQPGYTTDTNGKCWGVCINGMSISAVPGYIFSSDGDTVTIGIEYTSGKFQWLCFGKLDKTGAGAYTGGQFFTGSFSSYASSYDLLNVGSEYPKIHFFGNRTGNAGNGTGAVYLDADGQAGWRSCGYQGNMQAGLYNYLRFPSFNPTVTTRSYSSWHSLISFFSTRSPNTFNNLPPFARLYITTKRADGRYSFLGQPSGIRFVAPKNYNPGEEMPLGDDTWLIYPAHSKADPQGDYAGYAILRN